MARQVDSNDPWGGGGSGGGGGGGIDPPPGAFPGVGQLMDRRFRSNLIVSDEIKAIDLLYDVIFPAARMFMSQAPNGQIRLRNKKPVDWALGLAAIAAGASSFPVDDASPWITDQRYHLLIDPYTNDSEARDCVGANYSAAQNSVTLTTDQPTNLVISGFAGGDGAATPATASITVNSFTLDIVHAITLAGVTLEFIPRSGITTEGLASLIAATLRGHPALNRRFRFDWVAGSSVVNLTALFGTLQVDAPLTKNHVAPVPNPTTGPMLTATASGTFPAGDYQVTYAERNEHGLTLLAPYKTVTLAANEKITVSAVVPSSPGNTIVWYTVPEAASDNLRYHSENDGSGFVIDSLPLLSAPFPPDVNRTGTEVIRVKAIFSDRPEIRANIGKSNVFRATYEWSLGDNEDTVNRIDLIFREAAEDYRLRELRVRNDEHIAKTGKTSPKSMNGQAIDNLFQAFRVAYAELAEKRDANFFYRWGGTREALLLEEFDVVAVVDNGSGVVLLPVSIETIDLDPSSAGLPKVSFTARIFANWLYSDSVVKQAIPIVAEI